MDYREEFPDFDFEVPACVTANGAQGWDFEDRSWRQEMCPCFACDVFELWIDYADRSKREFPEWTQFRIACEGVDMLETDSWEDVRAFVEDGKRHYPEHNHPKG